MRILRFADPSAFAARAIPFLLEREAEHCLPIGIIGALHRGETYGPDTPYMALVEDEAGDVVEVIVMTPPQNLVVSHVAPQAEAQTEAIMRAVAEAGLRSYPDLPGVVGPAWVAREFTVQWQALTGQSARPQLRERVYRLKQVRPPRPAPGQMRRVTEADRPLLRVWLHAFSAEALGDQEDLSADPEIDRRLRSAASGMYVWQDGAITVSLAGYGNPTPHGIRIGPVYTPPEARGHGYASALVAALSQRLLDEGRQFVFLFTDLANPTSNHIYQTVGYEPVGDATMYQFTPDV